MRLAVHSFACQFSQPTFEVVGAGTKKVKDLTTLPLALSSKEMFYSPRQHGTIFWAYSWPKGRRPTTTRWRKVGERSEFANTCFLITSRITTIPPTCETLGIPGRESRQQLMTILFLDRLACMVQWRRAPVPDSEGYYHSVVRVVSVCSSLVIIMLQVPSRTHHCFFSVSCLRP